MCTALSKTFINALTAPVQLNALDSSLSSLSPFTTESAAPSRVFVQDIRISQCQTQQTHVCVVQLQWESAAV